MSLFQIASESAGSTGQSKEGRHHHPIVIVKEVDAASPLLWQACCTNEVLQSVDLTLVRAGGTGGKEQVVSRITLTNAEISKLNQYHPVLIPPPKKPIHGNRIQQIHTNELEEFSMTFMEITYTIVMKSKADADDWSGTT
jgi:type VI secretion system secreted protein Hcp